MNNSFLVSTRDETQASWLESALSGMGEIIQAGETIEELMRLVDLMDVSLLFIALDRYEQLQQCALVESLLEARPMITVVAVGDGHDSELVLAAMRAGAREFITQGMRASEVQALIRRLTTRLPQLPARVAHGGVTMLYGAQADPDASFAACHLALALQTSGHNTLFMDLGIPVGESKAVLGMNCNFHFDDVLRNLRRLDNSVIESAFASHHSGLRVLPLVEEYAYLEGCSSAELFLLFGSLRQNFDQIVVNACGQFDGDLIRTMVGFADNLLLHVDQSVPCSRRNLSLLQRWRSDGVKLDNARLLVDRFFSREAPDAATLSDTFELPLAATLPASVEQRLRCRNHGQSIYEYAPRDALSKALKQMAEDLVESRLTSGTTGVLRRLMGRVL